MKAQPPRNRRVSMEMVRSQSGTSFHVVAGAGGASGRGGGLLYGVGLHFGSKKDWISR